MPLADVTVFFLFIMKMAPPATRITATDAPMAMPAMAPTLRPSSESVFLAGGGRAGGGGGDGDAAIAPDPEIGVLTAVTMVLVMAMVSVDSMVAAADSSDIAVAMAVLAVAAVSALSYPMLMVSTVLPASALMSTLAGATPISRATFDSMAVSTVVVNEESSAWDEEQQGVASQMVGRADQAYRVRRGQGAVGEMHTAIVIVAETWWVAVTGVRGYRSGSRQASG